MNKKALITGITGQDGAYLSKFLLSKGYTVAGTSRNKSKDNLWRLNYLGIKDKVKIYDSCCINDKNIKKFIKKLCPNEIYNLSGVSSVSESFKNPIETFEANTTDCLRILSTIYLLNKPIKFYQASSSDMFGNAASNPCDEKTIFNPTSPYAISKLSAHQITINYRNNFNIYASTGILFNHESPLRGDKFVTKKIINGLVRLKMNKKSTALKLGNIDVRRDWGHSKDFVKSMYLILKHKKADDFIISSGENFSVKELIDTTCQILDIKCKWIGEGHKRKLVTVSDNRNLVVIDKSFFRPLDINFITGNSKKTFKLLKWKPSISFEELILEMVNYELKLIA